ncbi:MAG: histidine phosphatase family protein, partial [bacterium]
MTGKENATEITAVRHGETVWNKEDKWQGHKNSDLTDLGIKQAKLTGMALNHMKFDAFYASDLGRAVQTAGEISRQINLEFSLDSGLRERSIGILEGLTMTEFKAR